MWLRLGVDINNGLFFFVLLGRVFISFLIGLLIIVGIMMSHSITRYGIYFEQFSFVCTSSSMFIL